RGGARAARAGGRCRVMAGQALGGRGVAGPGGVAQFLGAAAQLAEIGALGKRGRHGVSLRRLRSAAQAEEEATAAHASSLGGGHSPSRGPGGALRAPPTTLPAWRPVTLEGP